MQVLVVRHAIAEQREEFARTGKDDCQRPLTDDGRRKMRRGAAGLRAVVPAIDVLATSPLLRAVQTAEILAAVYNGRNLVTVKELSPDSEFPPFLRWLPKQFTLKAICDATKSTEVLVCESRAQVDDYVRKAVAAGESTYNEPHDHGFVYGHGFRDLDGHIWKLVYMDPSAIKQR
ncbi:MAG: histidine phosphatase family protein [Gammaproteobacteria bacterium]